MGKARGAQWARVDVNLPQHRKSRRLAKALGDPLAWAYVVALWLYTIREGLGGELSSLEPEEIAQAAGWRGEPEAFVEALVVTAWLDRDATGLRLHDWPLYNGRYAREQEEDRAAARDRMRTLRALARIGTQPGAPGAEGAPSACDAGAPAAEPVVGVGAPTSGGEGPAAVTCSGERSGERSHARAVPSVPSRLVGEVRRGAAAPADQEADLAEFAAWWLAYPERARALSSRRRAFAAWQELREVRPALPAMLARLAAQRGLPAWAEEGGKYVPLAENYLRDLRWMDGAPPESGLAGAPSAPPFDVRPRLERLAALVRPVAPAIAERLGALRGHPVEVEEALVRLDVELLAAVDDELAPEEREEIRARVGSAVDRLHWLTDHQRDDQQRRFRRQVVRELKGLPLLSLFSPQAEERTVA